MRSRQTLLEIFSTFLQFEEDTVRGWATDTRLRRSMQTCLKQFANANSSEHFWTVYWHKRWQSEGVGEADKIQNPKSKIQNSPTSSHPSPSPLLSLAHLSAYLQESCYWSAQRTVARLNRSQHRLSDCFQVAIAAVPKILKAFDSNQLPSLKTYAGTAFGNVIRDDLRRRREADRCNEWGLLLKLSRKQLTESLQMLDWELMKLSATCWRGCVLKRFTFPRNHRDCVSLSPPISATWEAIAQRYNPNSSSAAQCTWCRL
ncbi:MAG: sigma-70 family RNA polymerase sigma factor, partial [Leptolyngbyaceae cyanobacterium RU_5_1]|nr:sigma-70 family RNA polymerase sigma factor [Leptolyngbyaceae cyanobacterium RU_5_1]